MLSASSSSVSLWLCNPNFGRRWEFSPAHVKHTSRPGTELVDEMTWVDFSFPIRVEVLDKFAIRCMTSDQCCNKDQTENFASSRLWGIGISNTRQSQECTFYTERHTHIRTVRTTHLHIWPTKWIVWLAWHTFSALARLEEVCLRPPNRPHPKFEHNLYAVWWGSSRI